MARRKLTGNYRVVKMSPGDMISGVLKRINSFSSKYGPAAHLVLEMPDGDVGIVQTAGLRCVTSEVIGKRLYITRVEDESTSNGMMRSYDVEVDG